MGMLSNIERLVKAGIDHVGKFSCADLQEMGRLAHSFGQVTCLENNLSLNIGAPFRLGLVAERGTGKTYFSNHIFMNASCEQRPTDRFHQFCADIEGFGKVFRYDFFVGVFGGTSTRHCAEYHDPAVRLKIAEHADLDTEPFDCIIEIPERGIVRIFASAAVAASKGYRQFLQQSEEFVLRPL